MMNIIKYALFIAALSLPVTNTHALEWVDYDGTIPDNAVMVNEGVEDRPICRKNERIGLIKNDLCHSVKAGGNFDKKDIDDGYQILVDTYNAYEVAELDSKPEYGTWVFDQELQSLNPVSGESLESLCEGTFTHLFDDAVADATSGLIPPGDCGNSEEEAFKAGVNSVYFYIVQQRSYLVGGSYGPNAVASYSRKSGGDWSGWHNNDGGLLKSAMEDYLNGRCSDVDESLYPTEIGAEELVQLPIACESFVCQPDNYGRYVRSSSNIDWSDDEEGARTYCSNADDEYFFGE
jgi:hypothetical protein